MPEGPELKLSRDYLRTILLGKKIINAFPLPTGRYSQDKPSGHDEFITALQKLGPATVLSIDTRGKFMYWSLLFENDTETWSLWTTYGMSGQWMKQQNKHAAYGIYFNDSGNADLFNEMYFVDPRHFGTLKWVRGVKNLEKKLGTLGPDILEGNVSSDVFAKRLLRRPNVTIAEALMDQKTLAGVGNYIKSEALYEAQVSPWRIVSDIQPLEFIKLRDAVLGIAKSSYESNGASLYTYKNVDGTAGESQDFFKVYGKKLDPLGHQILNEETQDGRTSWWVPNVQK
jgi:formamidopyrimidine-DNA glycosylase